MDMYLPGLPALATEFRVTASDVQLTLTSCLVGLACGQLVAGPASDRWGRKKPLLVGLACYTGASLLCTVATDITLLTGLRLVQGLAGAAGIVIARAVVRDLYSGVMAVRVFSALLLTHGAALILGPLIGGELLRFGTWRVAFMTLTVVGGVLLLSALPFVETLPEPARRPNGLTAFSTVLTDRVFVGYTLTGAFVFAALFSCIAAAPFVLQNVYGLTPQQFSYVFATNALALVLCGQLNRLLVRRATPQRMLRFGLGMTLLSGIFLLAAIVANLGLAGARPGLLLLFGSFGLVIPNCTALALEGYAASAGTASAVLGMVQYMVGAAVVPLVGMAGDHTAVPMALVVSVLGAAAIFAHSLTLAPAGPVLAPHAAARLRAIPGPRAAEPAPRQSVKV